MITSEPCILDDLSERSDGRLQIEVSDDEEEDIHLPYEVHHSSLSERNLNLSNR